MTDLRNAALLSIALVGIPGCTSFVEPTCDRAGTSAPQLACGRGTIDYRGVEGGVWIIRGDDGETYDPHPEVPAELRTPGLRVQFRAAVRGDIDCFHMVGTIVRLLEIDPS